MSLTVNHNVKAMSDTGAVCGSDSSGLFMPFNKQLAVLTGGNPVSGLFLCCFFSLFSTLKMILPDFKMRKK